MANSLVNIPISKMKDIIRKGLKAKKVKISDKQGGIDRAMLFLSSPGIGKTSAIKEVADELGIPYHIISPVQHAPEDFGGIPVPTKDMTTVNKLPVEDIFPTHLRSKERGIFFIDELTSAEFSTQGALYRLLLDGRTDTFTLPAGWLRVAAGNLMSDKALVNELSSALINRVSMYKIIPDTSEWVRYVIDKYSGTPLEEHSLTMAAFAMSLGADAFGEEPSTDTPFTSPRSLERAIEDIYLDIDYGADVSTSTAAKIIAYISDLRKLPKGEEFINNPKLLDKHKDKIFSVVPAICAYINSFKQQLKEADYNRIEKFLLSPSVEALGTEKDCGREFIYMIIKQLATAMKHSAGKYELSKKFKQNIHDHYPFLKKLADIDDNSKSS